MKTNLTAAAITALGISPALISPASAADMALKAPIYAKAPVAAPFSWSGFYVGGHVGGVIGAGRSDDAIALNPAGVPAVAGPGVLNPVSATSSANSPSGVIGGGQIGYNWQTSDWVFGVEGDVALSGARSSLKAPSFLASTTIVAPSTLAYSNEEKLRWLSTARARLGWADNFSLWYVTGGVAWGSVQSNYAFQNSGSVTFATNPAAFGANTMKTGWAVGGGVETTLAWLGAGNRWSTKIEYLYVDLGTVGNTFTVPLAVGVGDYTATSSSRIQEHLVRVGLNYRYGGADQANAGASSTADCTTCNWTGFYLGANIGGAIGHTNTADSVSLNPPGGFASVTNPVMGVSASAAPVGVLGGAQIGYNWQTANWVLGAEADFGGSSQRDHIDRSIFTASTVVVAPTTVTASGEQKLTSLFTLRGRLGFAQGSNLWYATGGAAAGRVTSNYAFQANHSGFSVGVLGPAEGSASFGTTKWGWTVGGGVERILPWASGNWSAKLEYLFVDLGTVNNSFGVPITGGTAAYAYTSSINLQDHVVRLGMNYRFGGPVAAVY